MSVQKLPEKIWSYELLSKFLEPSIQHLPIYLSLSGKGFKRDPCPDILKQPKYSRVRVATRDIPRLCSTFFMLLGLCCAKPQTLNPEGVRFGVSGLGCHPKGPRALK